MRITGIWLGVELELKLRRERLATTERGSSCQAEAETQNLKFARHMVVWANADMLLIAEVEGMREGAGSWDRRATEAKGSTPVKRQKDPEQGRGEMRELC